MVSVELAVKWMVERLKVPSKRLAQKMKFRYRRFYVDKKETVGGKNEIFISVKDSSFGNGISFFCILFTFIQFN